MAEARRAYELQPPRRPFASDGGVISLGAPGLQTCCLLIALPTTMCATFNLLEMLHLMLFVLWFHQLILFHFCVVMAKRLETLMENFTMQPTTKKVCSTQEDI